MQYPLKELYFMSINDRITYLCGCYVFRGLNDLTPKYITSKFIPVSRRHEHATRSSTNGNLQTCKFSTNYGKSTFRYKGTVTWNVICPNIKEIASLNDFKKSLKDDHLICVNLPLYIYYVCIFVYVAFI